MSAIVRGHFLVASALLAWNLLAAVPSSATAIATQMVETAPDHAFEVFLDRLMVAESGGRNDAKNPRSTALRPYQFIASTFLDISRRHFRAVVDGLSDTQILKLRTDVVLARRAAAAFCRESVKYLKKRGLEPTFAHLRLAYLLGPADAARILQAPRQTPVPKLLSRAVVNANPFMRGMTVADLLAKGARDVNPDREAASASEEAAQKRSAARSEG